MWVVDSGPAGGESAYMNTWTVGPLGSGRTRTVTWKLTAVRPGDYTVRWRLSPALEGDAELADGTTSGEFRVRIDDAPVSATVNGDGEVVRGRVRRCGGLRRRTSTAGIEGGLGRGAQNVDIRAAITPRSTFSPV